MSSHGAGTKHNELTGKTVVYTKLQCDEELDKKQDKLKQGDGIEILDDGTIKLAKLPTQEVNTLQTCVDLSFSPGNVLNFDKDHKLYEVVYSGTNPITYVLGGCLTQVGSGTQLGANAMCEVTLLVTLMEPMAEVRFSVNKEGFPITIVGDDDFTVRRQGQTMWFAIRSFRNRIILSKLGTF